MEHREGPGPALDDRGRRAARSLARLGPIAGALRPVDVAHPPFTAAGPIAAATPRTAPLVVRPGLTGLAQVRHGYETSMAEKLSHDLEWIADRSVLLYLRTLFATGWRVLRQTFRR